MGAQPGTPPQPLQIAAQAPVLFAQGAVAVIVRGRAHQHQIGEVRVLSEPRVAEAEEATEAPAVQAQAALTAVLAHPFQQRRQFFREVGGQAVMVLRPPGAPPVHQIELEAPRAQIAHQAAPWEQIVDQHVHRQGRHQHQRRTLGAGTDRHHLAVIQFDLGVPQRRVVAQLDQAVIADYLKRRGVGLHQGVAAEQALAGVAEPAAGGFQRRHRGRRQHGHDSILRAVFGAAKCSGEDRNWPSPKRHGRLAPG